MRPPRTLRITFSQTSAPAGGLEMSVLSRRRSPALTRWLWHTTQYLSINARWDAVWDTSGCDWGLAAWRAADVANTNTSELIDRPMPRRTVHASFPT